MKRQFIIHKQFVFILVACLLCPVFQDISLGQEFGKIYWMEDNRIRRANLDGTSVEDVIPNMPNVTDIALDLRNKKIYWVNASKAKIERANFDGSNIESIITGFAMPPQGGRMQIRCGNRKCEGTAIPDGQKPIKLKHEQLIRPYSIALDVGANKIYWGNWHIDIIQRANLDGSEMEDLTIDQRIKLHFTEWISPLNLALDIDAGKMYWTDGKRGRVGRANLDGTKIKYLITDRRTPYGLVLDLKNQYVYWTNSTKGKIQRIAFKGIQVKDVVKGLRHPMDIVIDQRFGKMYWINQGSGTIQQANLDGSDVITIVTGLIFPTSIALDTGVTYDVTPEISKLTTTWANVKAE